MVAPILQKLTKINRLFIAVVILPTVLAILYFGFLASDIYISQSRFVVRSPDKPAASGLGVFLKTAGFSSSGDEVYAARAFVESRDALRELNRGGAFQKAYSAGTISNFDRFAGFSLFGSFEDLYKYFQRKVVVETETSTSISTLTVRAYTAKDAQHFNERLLEMAEATVNKLNERGRQDLIQYAVVEVEDARRQASAASAAMAAYRNESGVVDPERQAEVQLQMISKLQDELVATKMQLVQLRNYTPQNPQIAVLQTKVSSLQAEIDGQLGRVAGDRKSLAGAAVKYQRLLLESSFSDKQLASALASLEQARNEARRKQAYVERIVQPNLPDSPLEPRRWRGILAVFLASIVTYGILKMLLASLLEHRD
jgi:capsular polysaccharide transport system permease protein